VSVSLQADTTAQQKCLQVAKSFVGTKEATGHNDGKAVEMFLQSVGRHKGDSWCAAFVSYCLTKANVKDPQVRSGLARSFKLKKSIRARDVMLGIKNIPAGTLVIWEKGKTISGHIGFVKKWWKDSGYTVEGNTSSGQTGSQADGDGVYNRFRKIEPANYFRITSFTLVHEK
jgi:hypothetical protein